MAVFERHVGNFSQGSAPDDPAGVIERYRYDALGRRVLVHTDRLQSCSVAGCDRTVRRTVWDGDQVLYEIRAPATSAESDAPSGHGLGSAQNQFGRIGYMHAFGIDRPLAAVRMSGNSILVTFYPHVNWRGLFEGATKPDTLLMDNDVTWPGVAASAYLGTPSDGAQEWMGSLVLEQADASGLLYRRNRYYDPMGGQFTQTDPIGLAGGLNLYGYAGGDPINFSDPFGLSKCPPNCVAGGVDWEVGRVPELAGYANALASELGYNLVITSGDRDYVPRKGSRSSNHLVRGLNPNRTGAIDFKAYTPEGQLVPFGQLFSESLDSRATSDHSARIIWHGETTATRGQHLHADKARVGHRYENGQLDEKGDPVYRPVERKP